MREGTPAGPHRLVEVVDVPRARVRRPGDLIGIVLTVLGIVVVLLLAVFAHGTTEGVTEDVQSAVARILRGIVQIPVSILELVLAICLPWIVVAERLAHRAFRQLLDAAVAAFAAIFVAVGAVTALSTFAPAALARGFTITVAGEATIAISPATAALAAFLTAAGARDQRASLAWSWNLFWVAIVLAVIQNELTLPGALVTVLLGRVVGLAVRYASGVYNERAYGTALVEGIRRAGLDPVRVVRVSTVSSETPRALLAATAAPIGYTERHVGPPAEDAGPRPGEPGEPGPGGGPPTTADAAAALAPGGRAVVVEQRPGDRGDEVDPAAIVALAADPATLALEQPGQGRVYAVTDADGIRWDVVALDGDRQVIGWLASVWSSLRLRGFDRRAVVSLRQAAERAALMSYAASAAGVLAPRLVGMAEAEDSVILAYAHVDDARSLSALADDEVSEDVLAQTWSQLRRAHAAGLAHRDLTADVVLVRGEEVAIAGWTNGDVASSELARRLDLAQMLALLAIRVGVPRAVESAARLLDPSLLAAIGPLLQPVALPRETREGMRENKALLKELRAALVEVLPTAEAEPVQLTRFSARTVLTVTIAVAAVWLVLSTLNIRQLTEAIQNANPLWAAAAFGLGLLTYVGAAMALMAFSPTRLTLWRTTLVQVAASVVALVAPAGVGPAATNLRYLNRRKVDTPLAVASVALIQVSQFITTIVLLLLIALVTGSGSGGTLAIPGPTALVAGGIVVAVVALAFTVPQARAWVWAKVAPTLRQVWPRLLWVVGQPGRLAVGLLGNLIMTGGFIAAFAASIAAFGQEVPLTQLAIIYLGGTALGSAVPTPGGLGTVELALSGGLTAAGVPAAVAASIAVLFRVLTFWLRIPVGWVAMRYLQRKNDL